MERYDSLDLDLECEEGRGGVAQKAAIFGGMFKRSSKSAEPSVQVQNNLSVNSELSNSCDSLSENDKEKGGTVKGILKRTSKHAKDETPAQATLSVQNTELSTSSSSLTDNNNSAKEKAGVLGGIFRRPPKQGHERRPSQDYLTVDNELSASSDSLSEKDNTKEKAGVLGGLFRRPPKQGHERRPSQDYLTVDNELSASSDSLSEKDNTKEKAGVLGGIFRRSPKPGHERRPSQDYLSVDNDVTASSDSLSEKDNTKEKAGVLGGIFRRSPKPGHERRPSQDHLSVDNELSASTDSLSEKDNTKEKGGMFSGMFKKSPKPLGARTQSQDDLSADGEVSASNENLTENSNAKEKGGMFGIFKKHKPLGARAQSQDDLSAHSELSASNDSLSEKTSKGGVMGKILKNPFHSSTPDKEKAEPSADSNEKQNSPEKPKAKQNGFLGITKSPFYTDKQQEKEIDDEETPGSSGKPSGHKQKDTDETELLRDNEKQGDEKTKPVKSDMIQRGERKDRSELPQVPSRPTEEEMKGTAAHNRLKGRGTEDIQENKNIIPRERKGRVAEPLVPPRPTDEEMNRTARRGPQKTKKDNQSLSDDEGLRDSESLPAVGAREGEEGKLTESKAVRKPKRHNPFMPRGPAKAQSDDEGLKEDESPPAEAKRDEAEDKVEEPKVRKPKKHNPFMFRSKAQSDDEGLNEDESRSSDLKKGEGEDGEKMKEPKVRKTHNPFMPRSKPKGQRNAQDGNTAENEGRNKSLFDQLEEFRLDGAEPDDNQDVDGLMEWWDTVEQWDDLPPKDEDMTEKEEAKAFAVTAEKVQKGIRVFNKLFSERAESLWLHVINLHAIADGLDQFNKKTKIAQITGGSTSAIGGIATIAGLALAPITMGTSLIITAVGLGVATAGGLTSAGAGISNQVNNSLDRKKVEKIVEDYQTKMTDLNKCMTFIKQGIEHLRKFDLIKMKKHAYNRDFPALNNIYEDGAMAGKAILINANEIMRVVQIANVAGSTAARAVQIASMATGVLTGLFVGMDIYFVAKDSKELKKGAKSEFASKIREVAEQLHEGLVELNGIRDELHSTNTPENAGDDKATPEDPKKEKEDKPDSSEEDEIDRIKKAIKKDLENREYV